ncbi:MAG: tRNA-intron lyase [Desulfurococcus sp.]|nr:tRNA-intron lyase [Desulfurococcus sp.]
MPGSSEDSTEVNPLECRGYVLYNRVVIPDFSCARKIYWNGYYGSFLGVSKPRDESITAPLELSLIEALYLVEEKRLKVLYEGSILNAEDVRRLGVERVPRFIELYAVYRDLREKKLIPRRGLKFGCDYLVYRRGPGVDHAPFGVQVYRAEEHVDPIELVRMGRLLHSVRKNLVIAIYTGSSVLYHMLEWWKP